MTNQLFYGDNLDVLRQKVKDESVDLCYIDPPFNSKRNYFQIYNNIGKDDAAQAQAFMDTWTWNERAMQGFDEISSNATGGYPRQTIELMTGLARVLGNGPLLAYLVGMTQRVNEIWRVLKPTGSFYLHCDPTCSHYLKLVLDTLFCGRGGDYRNEIIWKRRSGSSSAVHQSNHFGICTDTIFYYVKSNEAIFKSQYNFDDPSYKAHIKKYFKHIDENGRRFCDDNLSNPAHRPNLMYEYRGIKPPKNGWAISRENMEQWDKEGRLYFTRNGGIRRKTYLDELKGKSIQNLWLDISPINSQAQERLGYPTQKPEALLERIIQASSNEGDTVLDAFCGCGTTIAVAQRLRRNWIGIDITYQSIAVILQRLEDSFGAETVAAIQLGGLPKDMDSARALATKKDDRLRKEFEKWAVLTYSKNRAAINEKKGADKGVDGIAYFATGHQTTARVIFQVKSGKVQRNDIATLNSDRQREQAELAILLTLEEPTKPMRDEVFAAGVYHHTLLNREVCRVQIVSIQDLLDGRRIDLPLSLDVLKTAPVAATQQAPLL